MDSRVFNVLFICTGNAARSIIAEAILNRWGAGTFHAYSAGTKPRGEVHPFTIDLLRQQNFDPEFARSKSWDEFTGADAPKLDFVFTLCDRAAGETCPAWPGDPMTAHWALPDPLAHEGSEVERRLAFADVFRMLDNRISILVNLPLPRLDQLSLQKRLDAIGQTGATGQSTPNERNSNMSAEPSV